MVAALVNNNGAVTVRGALRWWCGVVQCGAAPGGISGTLQLQISVGPVSDWPQWTEAAAPRHCRSPQLFISGMCSGGRRTTPVAVDGAERFSGLAVRSVAGPVIISSTAYPTISGEDAADTERRCVVRDSSGQCGVLHNETSPRA